jgi:lipopolysaccharide biosynthesis glycosyltransferase
MIHLVFCSDLNYLPWCAVPAKTAVNNISKSDLVSVHLILSEDCKAAPILPIFLQKLKKSNVFVHTYFVEQAKYSQLPVSGHGTIANYFRLLIPELLPKDIQKVIYLDCDLLVCHSLSPLWKIDLNDAPIAAVSNMSLFESEAVRLGIPYMHGIFNSGVLVMNLSVFREENLHSKCINMAIKMGDEINYWDQDVLNILLIGRWLKLDCEWNVQHGYFLDPLVQDKYSVIKPKIIHFSGNSLKPWQSSSLPFSDEYMREFQAFGLERKKHLRLSSTGKNIFRKGFSALKKLVKGGISLTLLNPFFVTTMAPLFRPVVNKLGAILSAKDEQKAILAFRAVQEEIIQLYYPDLSVASGPFQGMKYPTSEAIGSSLTPKLAGSYEIEITKFFAEKFLADFTDFFDIGCAEGYYAVGVAKIASHLNVYAYDINPDACSLCNSMSRLNKVSNRVAVDSRFSLAKFADLKIANKIGRTLVLVDCEGAEASIFSSESYQYRQYLADSTIIVESHEFIRRGIARHIIAFFTSSHSLERVPAVGDLLRPSYYHEYLPVGVSNEMAHEILAERRPAPMEWLIFHPLKFADS